MSVAFNVLLHCVLVVAAAIFAIGLWRITMDPQQGVVKRALRGLALLAGALVALGAEASKSTFSTFAVDSLATTKPGSMFLAAAVPGATGIALAWFLLRTWNRREDAVAVRVLGFVGMLALVAFIEIYAQATKTHGVFLGAAAVPNAAFVVGVTMYLILKTAPNARRGT